MTQPKPENGACGHPYSRRVYPLDAHDLSEEQIAVAFAMTSRRPEAFDEISEQVSKEKAADFHERWVLGYGHASVAEHAVVHLAVENVSRLAVDTLEDNRLASYTEKSSRYQVMPEDYFYIPDELVKHPALKKEYEAVCQVGVLGLLNGILTDAPAAVIGAKGTRDERTGRFVHIRTFVDLRRERTNVVT